MNGYSFSFEEDIVKPGGEVKRKPWSNKNGKIPLKCEDSECGEVLGARKHGG
jgi:hypothetical protein